MTGRIIAWLLLVATWGLVLDRWGPADLILGGVVAAGVLVALRPSAAPAVRAADPPLLTRLTAIGPLLLASLRDIVVGTWRVTLVVIGARPLSRPGIVVIPFGDRTARGVAVSCFFITLAPGETLVGIDRKRREMFVHVIDAGDPDGIRAHFERFYRRHQRRVWP